jgi:F-type H+-transporting ATPase subunit b
MISVNATLLIQVFNFLILLFVLNRILFRPTLRVLKERSEYMERTRQEIREFERKTEARLKDYQSQEIHAHKKASKARRAFNHEGYVEAEEIFRSAKKEVMTIKKNVRDKVEQEIAEARHYLSANKDAEHLSYEITDKVIGRRI